MTELLTDYQLQENMVITNNEEVGSTQEPAIVDQGLARTQYIMALLNIEDEEAAVTASMLSG